MPTGSCSWNRKIKSAKQRFKILTEFDSEAVLDQETGLVWERRPSTESMAWSTARLFCAQKAVGGRGGWRLPSFSELASLVDPSITSNSPRLPIGHPFIDVQPDTYWSATLFAEQPGFALAVLFNFVGGGNAPILVTDANTGAGTAGLAWAVRGGSSGPETY